MQVAVEVMGQFKNRAFAGRKALVVELPDGSRVGDAIRAVGLEHDEEWNASIDGRLVEADRVLLDGEVLFIFTAIAGGSARGKHHGREGVI